MENKELINCLKERKKYLEGEWYQLRDLANEMDWLNHLEESDIKDLIMAINATQKALKAVRRIIDRNKQGGQERWKTNRVRSPSRR